MCTQTYKTSFLQEFNLLLLYFAFEPCGREVFLFCQDVDSLFSSPCAKSFSMGERYYDEDPLFSFPIFGMGEGEGYPY